jgi:hypothetical protein
VPIERLWHVTLIVGGEALDPSQVLAAMKRLAGEHPFLLSGRYAADRAELRYWEEAPNCADACALALRLWGEHRTSARLPDWSVLGVEVLVLEEHRAREPVAVVPAGRWLPI